MFYFVELSTKVLIDPSPNIFISLLVNIYFYYMTNGALSAKQIRQRISHSNLTADGVMSELRVKKKQKSFPREVQFFWG